MKTILVTAYAVNPYKGSEEGMGWHFIRQIARFHRVIAVTRANNAPFIRQFMAEHPEDRALYDRIEFRYFDWPRWMICWKRGPLLSMVYYYGWQLTVALWLLRKRLPADIVHNLNFHNDWTPSFLWILGKPMVWGPVGHHPAIPGDVLRTVYGKSNWYKDKGLWWMKQLFWRADPFLRLTVRKADKILCMNSTVASRLQQVPDRCMIVPSVASTRLASGTPDRWDLFSENRKFQVLSVGRMVPLKGFDLTIRSYARFYHSLPPADRERAELVLIGSGPSLQRVKQWIEEEGIGSCTHLIPWMPKERLEDFYRSASVFLFPSHEGAGMVVAEAMSHGLPVICLDNAGPGQFVPPYSALRIPYTTYADTVCRLAGRLGYLFTSPKRRWMESQWCLERFNEQFDWNVRGEQLRAIYTSLNLSQ